jgi:hypothetical protein
MSVSDIVATAGITACTDMATVFKLSYANFTTIAWKEFFRTSCWVLPFPAT